MSGVGKLAFLGFGEAGQALLDGLRGETPDLAVAAFDIKTCGADTAAATRAAYAARSVDALETPASLAGAKVIFSTVTADQASLAARSVAVADLDGALYLDCNSCAPSTKISAARVIEDAGGRYVDMAVMAPVHPQRHKTPCLLSGPHAAAAAAILGDLGMNVTIVDGPVGAASIRKMVRSVMIKGLEALTVECLLAARKAGIEDETLASLDASFPGFGWAGRAPYMLERVVTHGTRRGAEMREVAKTLTDLGLAPRMSSAAAELQAAVGGYGLDAGGIDAADMTVLTDALLAALSARTVAQ